MSYKEDIASLVPEEDADEVIGYIEETEEELEKYFRQEVGKKTGMAKKVLTALVASKTDLSREEISETVGSAMEKMEEMYEEKLDKF